MKKYETLKAIVILQAVSMIALAGFVIWYLWPSTTDDEAVSPTQDQNKANAEDEVVAVIGGQKITRQQLLDELLLLHGDETLQNMLEHLAIQLAAKEYNIYVSDKEIHEQLEIRAEHYESVEQYLKVMTEQVGILPAKLYQDIEDELLLIKIAIKDIKISDKDIQAYLDERPDSYTSRYTFGLEWIVVDELTLANDLLQKLEQGESFNVLAQQYSTDQYTASNGGKLGFIEEEDSFYPKQLREAATSLEVGSVAGPILLDQGYVLIKLVEKRAVKYIDPERREKLVRQQLALEQADSLDDVLTRLVTKYGSLIKKQKL